MRLVPISVALLVTTLGWQCGQEPLAPLTVARSRDASTPPPPEQVTRINALVIYSQDADDDYPFPSAALRQKIYRRISDYFDVMSYGQHQVVFRELSNDGDYFRTSRTADEYKRDYYAGQINRTRFDGPYAYYNHEVLQQVLARFGEAVFRQADLIVSVATDGGPGWYVQSVNAQGFARLGFNFTAAGRRFPPDYGGITVEIGSDFTGELYDETLLYWIFAHEYAHYLGFRRHRSRTLGIYSLMTGELAANDQMVRHAYGPNPLDPLLLARFGWLNLRDSTRVQVVKPVTGEVNIILKDIRSRTGIVLVAVPLPGTETKSNNPRPVESFLVAYHRRDSNPFDAAYPGSGLLIWHMVNESILDVECAVALPDKPNKDHLDVQQDMGGLPDDFFNSANGREFTPTSNPNSNIWGVYHPEMRNQPTGIAITDIEENGETVRFRVRFAK